MSQTDIKCPTQTWTISRIDFLLCTPGIEKIIFRIGILPIHEMSLSDHRRFILDVHLHAFLNDLDHKPSSNTRLLSTNPHTLHYYIKSFLNSTPQNIILSTNLTIFKIRLILRYYQNLIGHTSIKLINFSLKACCSLKIK